MTSRLVREALTETLTLCYIVYSVFGGDEGPPLAIATNPDSAWILSNLDYVTSGSAPVLNTIKWSSEPLGWASEPLRRIYHAATAVKGTVWITGGMKDDGSDLAFNEMYCFTPAQPPNQQDIFSLIAPIPKSGDLYDIVGHASVLSTNNTLIILGGYSPSRNELIPFTQIWIIDLSSTSSTPTLLSIELTGTTPSARRNFAYALLDGNKILIHGGADAYLQNVFSDGWILDLDTMIWNEAINMAPVLGARYDHIAVGLGNQALFAFGE